MGVRQISFVGTGKYVQTNYALDGSVVPTCYVTEAIARVVRPVEVQLVATEPAWTQHGGGLSEALAGAGVPRVDRVPVPDGGTAGEQWQQFEILRGLLEPSEEVDAIVIDVTHGWRAQPFVAAAVLAYQRATVLNPVPVRVLYGAYTSGVEVSPVWDLTAFLEVVDWGQGLQTLLQTGRATSVVSAARRVAKAKGRAWADAGRSGPKPVLHRMVDALEAFSADLSTLRTGDLVGPDGSASRLTAAIALVEAEVRRELPPLYPLLGQVDAMARPLIAASLGEDGEQEVLAALGALYLRLDRLQEAITIAREARVSLHAEDDARRAGRSGRPVDGERWGEARVAAEKRWGADDPDVGALRDVRNTLNHGGFGAQPPPAAAVRRQVTQHVERIGVRAEQRPGTGETGEER